MNKNSEYVGTAPNGAKAYVETDGGDPLWNGWFAYWQLPNGATGVSIRLRESNGWTFESASAYALEQAASLVVE